MAKVFACPLEEVFSRRILQIYNAKVSVWAAEFGGEDDKALI